MMVQNPQLFWLISLYYIRHHKIRTLFSVFVLMLGAILLFWTLVSYPNDAKVLATGVDILTGQTQLDIRASAGQFSADYLEAVRQTEGVRIAAPLVSGGGLIVRGTELIVFWGIDPTVEQEVRSYPLVQGRFPAGPGEILVTESYTTEKGYTLEDSLSLVGPGGLHQLTIVGTLADTGLAVLNGGDLLVMHYQDAQVLLGHTGLDSISILIDENQDLAAASERVQTVLPDTVDVANPRSRHDKSLADRVVTYSFLSPTRFRRCWGR